MTPHSHESSFPTSVQSVARACPAPHPRHTHVLLIQNDYPLERRKRSATAPAKVEHKTVIDRRTDVVN